MIQTTTWTSDTCGCTVHYQWDDSLPAEERVHVPVETVLASSGEERGVHKCPAHSNKKNVKELFDTMVDENSRKNIVVGQILEAHPNLKVEDVKFDFDENRVLKIQASGLSALQKVALRTLAVTKVGAGKVQIL